MRPFRSDKIPLPRLSEDLIAAIENGVTDLEIGAGQGYHAIRYALNHPHRKVVAIERTEKKFERFLSRFRRHTGLHNLIPVHADAISVVSHYVADGSLERIFLLYPNPYPKKKQMNIRWHNSPFMSCLLAKLKSSGRLHLSTNLSWYAEEARSALTTLWKMKLAGESLVYDPRLAQTHFERKYLQRGETCFRQIYIKD